MLRKGLAGGVESGDSSASADTVNPTTPKRFESYELVTGEEGKPVELGRGAMGVTDVAAVIEEVQLQCFKAKTKETSSAADPATIFDRVN
jgi:hypothetical protein